MEKKEIKYKLHPRNKHRERYNFEELCQAHPELKPFVAPNKYGNESIDFFDPKAVKALNKALLKHHYKVTDWDVPEGYLCPPIPGRADYVHNMADVLKEGIKGGAIPKGSKIKCLDIGVGANAVYPIIGHQEYGWSFVGTDIDKTALESAKNNLNHVPNSDKHFELRFQKDSFNILFDAIKKEERFDLMFCNPPFHSSAEEAQKGTLRKLKNLKGKKVKDVTLNFGGNSNELWYEGGEKQFLKNLVHDSMKHSKSVLWFSSLVSKQSNIKPITETLKKARAREVKVIEMGQGNKVSRIVVWTFLKPNQRNNWRNTRWK